MTIAKELLGYSAEQERLRLLKRPKNRIAIARRKGRYKGRPTKCYAESKGKDKSIYDKIITELSKGNTVMNISSITGVSRNTIYKIKENRSCDII